MAEPESSSGIVPSNSGEDTGYTIEIKRFNASGVAPSLRAHIPAGMGVDAIRANPVLLSAILKDGHPVWMNCEPGFVLTAVLYSASLGLDILQGDIYPVEGRLGVSDWAKIKYARAKGFSAKVTMEEGPTMTFTWKTKTVTEQIAGNNHKCTVKVLDRNGNEVNEYSTELKQWFGNSTEWKNRPKESLRRKCLARAYQEVCPVGIDPEEIPDDVGAIRNVKGTGGA